MRSTGAYVLCFFAAAWGTLALSLLGEPMWLRALPAGLSLVLAGLTALLTRQDVPRSLEYRKHAGRTVALWSVIEGIVIFATVNILGNTGHGDWVVAAIAIIVGLHFYPLAIGLRVPLYALTATVMIAVTAAVLYLLPAGVTANVTIALGGAATLWLTVLAIMATGPRHTPVAA